MQHKQLNIEKKCVLSFSFKQEPVPTFVSVLKVHNAGWTSPGSLLLVGVLYWKASCRVSARPSSEIRLEPLFCGHAMGKSGSTPEKAVLELEEIHSTAILIHSMDAMFTNSGNRCNKFWKKICVALRKCWCPRQDFLPNWPPPISRRLFFKFLPLPLVMIWRGSKLRSAPFAAQGLWFEFAAVLVNPSWNRRT